jgi:hypothetical protein
MDVFRRSVREVVLCSSIYGGCRYPRSVRGWVRDAVLFPFFLFYRVPPLLPRSLLLLSLSLFFFKERVQGRGSLFIPWRIAIYIASHHIDGVCEQYVQQRRDELMGYDNVYIGYEVC